MIVTGTLDHYKKRHSEISDNCNVNEISPLGFLKLASIFTMLLLGILISFILLFYELFKTPKEIETDTLSEEELESLIHLVKKFQKTTNVQTKIYVISGRTYKIVKKPETSELSIQRHASNPNL